MNLCVPISELPSYVNTMDYSADIWKKDIEADRERERDKYRAY